MSMAIEAGIAFAFIAMIAWGIGNFLNKKAVLEVGVLGSFIYKGFFLLPLVFLATLATGFTIDIQFILLTIGISIIGFFPVYFLLTALKKGKVGIVMPIPHTSVVSTVLLSVFFFPEALSAFQYSAIALVIIGIVSLSITRGRGKNSLSQGVFLAFIASLLWGLTFFLWKIPVNFIGPAMTSLIIEGCIVLWAAIAAKGKIPLDIGRKNWGLMAIYGVSIALGSVSYSLALSISDVSIVAPIVFSNILIYIPLTRIFYREKLEAHHYLSSILILAGLVMLVT